MSGTGTAIPVRNTYSSTLRAGVGIAAPAPPCDNHGMEASGLTAMATIAQELTFEQKLDQLARVAIEVGLGLQPGQELLMTSSIEAVPLARRITEHAYRAGASLVTTLYGDDETTLMRLDRKSVV